MSEATKDSILGYKGRPPKAVEIPEWGGTVYVRVMSGVERDAFEDETYQLNGKDVTLNRDNARARLLVRCLCGRDGSRLFGDADARKLGDLPADVLDKVFAVAQAENGLTAKDVDDLAKNSDGAPNA